jgi:hypothetical protein
MADNLQTTEELEAEFFDVSEKDIFKFTSDFPAATGQGIPNHYHICVKTENAYMLFNCCTSQSGKVSDRIKYFGRSYVKVSHMKKTGLSELTYVDCDNVFTMSHDDFDKYAKEGKIVFTGILAGADYQEVVKGVLASDMVEENTKKLFR